MCASCRTDRRWTAGHRRRADAAMPRSRRLEWAAVVAGAADIRASFAEAGQAVPTSRRVAVFRLEPARPHPEALAPDAARRNRLQFAVAALVREIDGIGNSRHRLDADEGAILRGLRRGAAPGLCRRAEILAAASAVFRMRRPDHHRSKVWTQHHVEALRPSYHRHRRPPLLVALQVRKHVIEVVVIERGGSTIRKKD